MGRAEQTEGVGVVLDLSQFLFVETLDDAALEHDQDAVAHAENFREFRTDHEDRLAIHGQLVDQLVESMLVKTVDDLFKLTSDDLLPLERMAEKSATNIIVSIDNSKQISFSRFLYAFGIRNVGEHLSKVLEKYFEGDFPRFMLTTKTELESVFEVGEIVADEIIRFWSDASNVEAVHSCFNLGVIIESLKLRSSEQLLHGKTFVFTGSLRIFTRKEAQNIVESLGGKYSSSVGKKTDFVVTGESSGSKLTKAQKIGVPVITEDEFQKLISDK